MKRTALVLSAWTVVVVFFAGYGLAQAPIPISPGADEEVAVVISGCPTFSWSEVEDAISYQLSVFRLHELSETISYGEMALLKTPELDQNIPDRGFSWTPSANNCLLGGTYVWYVAASNIEGVADWSKGKLFKVDALAGFAAVIGEAPDQGAVPTSESMDSSEEDGSGAFSLEQIIHSNVASEILSVEVGPSLEADEIPRQSAVLMETQGPNNTSFGLNAGQTISEGYGNAFFGKSAGYWNDANGEARGDYNTFIGHHAGNKNRGGDNNTFVGYQAGFTQEDENADYNTFLGNFAGYSNLTGFYNTFVGNSAGVNNTTGNYNTFIGSTAGEKNSTGGSNTFIGGWAGQDNTTGNNNTFIGLSAGQNNTTGYDNTFLGLYSGRTNTTGYNNTFLGRSSGYDNTTGYNNTFFGRSSGYDNTTGNHNTFIGKDAGLSNTTANHNTFIGYGTGHANTTGSQNTFLGSSAGQANTTGLGNTFLGKDTGLINTSGPSNTFVGNHAGVSNTTGGQNTFIGSGAGSDNDVGYVNTFIGNVAGANNTTGHGNTFVGWNAGLFNTVASYNTFIGMQTGYSNNEGYCNTFIGANAGSQNTSGNGNIFIGNGAGSTETGSNKLCIDNSSTASPLIYGEFNNDFVIINGSLGVGKTPTTSFEVNGTATATSFVGNGSGLTNLPETDPQVGAVTNAQWCVGNGSAVQCNQAAPVTSETDPQVGAVTNAKWCVGNGSAVQCNQAAPDPSSTNEFQSLSIVDSTLSISNGNSVNIAGGEADNLGNHKATQALNLNGNWISGDGDDEGIYIDPTGDIKATGVLTVSMAVSPSDERFKKDIRPIYASLQKVMALSGISYNWKNEEFRGRGFSNERQIGLIAQDVERSLPELVHTGPDGYKAVDYGKLTAVLVEAVKELKAENEILKAQLDEIRAFNDPT